MMNKKMILLISMVFCGNFGVTVASEAPVVLTDNQNKVYQGLVAKFKVNQLTAEDNTVDNIAILTQQEAFLAQAVKAQGTKKQSLWPYGLAASVSPALIMSFEMGSALRSFQRYLTSFQRYLNNGVWDTYIYGGPKGIFSKVGNFLQEPAQLPYTIDEALGLSNIVSRSVYTVAPAIAFYGIYKMYSSLKNQQQELETVREILATLKSFGQPS